MYLFTNNGCASVERLNEDDEEELEGTHVHIGVLRPVFTWNNFRSRHRDIQSLEDYAERTRQSDSFGRD